MNTLRKKIFKATALALVLSVTHVCLSAELVRAASARLLSNVASQGTPSKGRLTTRGNNSVTVNGNSAKTGETIFSGQSIQTPAGVGATVNLPGLGRIDIAPNTNFSLTFGDGKIGVTLLSGCVILTANKGVTGMLESGGSTQQTDPATGGTIDVCKTTPGAAPVVGQGAAAAAGAGAAGAAGAAATTAAATTAAASGGLFGLGTAGTIGFVVAASAITAAAVITPCKRGPNPSPGTPRGRNDECRD
jgi:hypothetical protein